ncbi:MAG TPA: glycosyltransferase family 9 protein, partial [Pseudonocardiaceae bacterium]
LVAHDVPADPRDLYLPAPVTRPPAPGAVVVNPGASHASRRWPVSRFAAVARTLAAEGHRVVVTGTADERERALNTVHRAGLATDAVLAGRTGLAELAALVAGAALVLTADTGVAHLSYAYGTPSVVLFGPVTAARWGPPPWGPHIALSDDARRRGDPFSDTPDPALLGVGVADVLAAARAVTAPGRRPRPSDTTRPAVAPDHRTRNPSTICEPGSQ